MAKRYNAVEAQIRAGSVAATVAQETTAHDIGGSTSVISATTEEIARNSYDQLWGDGDQDNYTHPSYRPKNRDLYLNRRIQDAREGGTKRSKNPEHEFLGRVSLIMGIDEVLAKELFSARPYKAIRTNRFGYDPEITVHERARLLIDELEKANIEATELDWFAGSLLFKASDMPLVSESDVVRSGRAFIQSPTSYMPVISLEVQEGDAVLDMCAAPGGKTALIADRSETSVLVANELKPRRLERMRDVLGTLMIKGVRIVNHDAKHLGHHYGNDAFNRILADVECSTEAGVNFESREPLKGWSRERVERSARLQRQIIRVGYDLLKPGGTLVYSTCSLAPEENEFVIDALLNARRDAIVQPIELTVEDRVRQIRKWGHKKITSEASEGVLRIAPNQYLEPFTVIRIRKPTGEKELDSMMHHAVNLDELVTMRESLN